VRQLRLREAGKRQMGGDSRPGRQVDGQDDSGKAGGPYEMTVAGKNTVTVKDILVGEVWVCSGQSNMEFALKQAKNSAEEIADANNYPQIRSFNVGKKVIYTPMYNCGGKWQVCSAQTAGNFTAVGYFFGRELNKQLKVPVGLIHTSWAVRPLSRG